jgi:uncharacterized protein
MARQTLRDGLLGLIRRTPVVDCHSHTMLRRDYCQEQWSLFNLMSYFARDIASVTGKDVGTLMDGAKNDQERWERLKGVLEKSRNVSYWRHYILMYQELFGLKGDDLTDRNWKGVNEQIKKKAGGATWYDDITRKRCRIKTAVRNIPWFEDWEPEYFTAVLRMESALALYEKPTRDALAKHVGMSIGSLKAAKAALAKLTEQYAAQGAVGVKLAHAYRRTLASEPVSEATASRIFRKALAGKELSWPEAKQVEDHIIFFLGELASDMDLVFQIHTGVQGNYSVIPDSNPLHLIPLLLAFPRVKFDLFHAGYPYSREMGMLGKHHPNTYLNMCWMYVITMEGSRRSLAEWIDLVPGHRLLGFGSDVGTPEFILSHLRMAESCLADVLARKVERDFLSKTAATDLVRMMLHDNACELYGLEGNR